MSEDCDFFLARIFFSASRIIQRSGGGVEAAMSRSCLS
jgi:hypothetical protein